MALWRTVTFESMEAMIDYMNGAIVGGNIQAGAAVDGLTLVIDPGTGNVTCTFAPAKSRPWTPEEIVAKIDATAGLANLASIRVFRVGHTGYDVGKIDRRLNLVGDPEISVKSTSTALAALGYPVGADIDQVITPQASVEAIYRNVDGQDNWTVILYS